MRRPCKLLSTDHLQFPYVVVSEWVPDDTGILQDQPYQGLDTKLLGLPWALLYVSLQKCSGFVDFFGCSISMFVQI